MQQPDKHPTRSSPDEDELAEAVADAIAGAVMRLPPETRLRLIAFLHLMEEPGTTRAELDTAPPGFMRLVLTHTGLAPGTRSN